MNTDLYLQKIVIKLPYALQAGWRKTVSRMEEAGDDATFKDLVEFVDQQTRIAKHPVFSNEALLEAEGKERSTGSGNRRLVSGSQEGRKTLLATHISTTSGESSVSDSNYS